jgi:hypothetical protein
MPVLSNALAVFVVTVPALLIAIEISRYQQKRDAAVVFRKQDYFQSRYPTFTQLAYDLKKIIPKTYSSKDSQNEASFTV